MDSSDHNQSCAICLDSLISADESSCATLQQQRPHTIGAVVPCGHVFHRACWGRWYSAHKRRTAGRTDLEEGDNPESKCKCPMCNAPCDRFVPLFLEGVQHHKRMSDVSSSSSFDTTGEDSESIVLLAKTCHDSAKRLDRVKERMKHYKKETKALETKLHDERRLTEETMNRLAEKQSKERRAWKRQHGRLLEELKLEREAKAALTQEMEHLHETQERERRKWKKQSKKLEQKLVQELNAKVAHQAENFREWSEQREAMQGELDTTMAENQAMKVEIDRTIELQVEERRSREQQMKDLQKELATAKEDKAKAEAKVQKAIDGIAQMRVYHEIRKEQMEKLAQEKAQLQEELRKMKEAAAATEEVLFG